MKPTAILFLLISILHLSVARPIGRFGANLDRGRNMGTEENGGELLRASSDEEVLFVQLVHRHGARTPLITKEGNPTQICGSLGCGMLTTQGKDMLRKLGAWARQRYMILPPSSSGSGSSSSTDSYAQVSTTAYIANYSFYYPKLIDQRSTDVTRTLQSAAAFLQGFFGGDDSAFYPCINTMPLPMDALLHTGSIPSFQIPREVNKKELDDTFYKEFIRPVLSVNDLYQMGLECGLVNACKPNAKDFDLTDCFKAIFDVAASYNAEGRLSAARLSLTTAMFLNGTLGHIKSNWHLFEYGYNSSNSDDAHRGPTAEALALELLGQFNAFLNGTQEAVFREYSAHDGTLCALTATLGQQGPQDFLPGFGTAYFFELFRRSDSNSSAPDLRIRVLRGAPEQTPGDHSYSFTPYNISCMDSASKIYHPELEGCPLADWARYLDSRLGSSSQGGQCYLKKDVRSAIHCDKVEKDAPSDPLCSWYRSMCPEWACPSGSYLSYPMLNCVSA